MNCKDCNQEMKSDVQGFPPKQPIIIFTCFNRACSLYSVTLTESQFKSLTEDQLNDYREMVARLKKTLGIES